MNFDFFQRSNMDTPLSADKKQLSTRVETPMLTFTQTCTFTSKRLSIKAFSRFLKSTQF